MSFNFFTMMHDVDYCLLGSVGQAAADAKSLNLWTMSTTAKTDAWLNGDDPTISNWINTLPDDPEQMASLLQQNCPGQPGTDFSIDHWSSKLALQLQMLITKDDNDSSKWGAVVGAIGPFSSLISSTMTQYTTTGDTEGKNMQSQMQTDNSATQPIADMGSTCAQNISTLSNLLAQLSPS